jgi:serine O-acetyltransferase
MSSYFLDSVRADLNMYSAGGIRLFVFIKCFFMELGFFITFIYRVQRILLRWGFGGLLMIKVLDLFARLFSSNFISFRAEISPGLKIPHATGVVIGEGAVIGRDVKIYQGVTIGAHKGRYPVIGDNVTIFPGAVLVGGIKISNNVIVGPNAVVVEDVEEDLVVVNPKAVVLHRVGL